jgi:hypothetical protein
MKKGWKLSAVVCSSALCMLALPMLAPADNQEREIRPNGKGSLFHSNKGNRRSGNASTTGGGSHGIRYYGGPVMLGTVSVYYIWYGDWTGNSATTILTDLASNIGGSPYFNINTTYFDGSKNYVSNSVVYGGSTTDNYSRGTDLSDADVQNIVTSAISAGKLPGNPNGVYFVLTSQDVAENSGFCTNYCAWHSYGTITGTNIKYAFIGNADRCPYACEAQTTSPNENAGADAMASVIAHELEEAVTDPNLNAWFDMSGDENADKCGWTYGTVARASNGSFYNMILGARQYLIQQNWVNASGGYCALSF